MASNLLSLFDSLAERERIISAMQADSRVYLTALRSFAWVHAMKYGSVTIDDVRAAVAREQFPMPREIGKDERLFGAVFSCSDFVAVRQQQSARAERIARSGRGASSVTVYRLKERV